MNICKSWFLLNILYNFDYKNRWIYVLFLIWVIDERVLIIEIIRKFIFIYNFFF